MRKYSKCLISTTVINDSEKRVEGLDVKSPERVI